MPSIQAQAAKIIRKTLKENGIKATVKSRSASMMDAVDVKILQDVTPAALEEITSYVDQFQYGSFNGMIDCYEYTNKREDLPQVKYTTVSVEYSEEIKKEAAAFVAKVDGLPEYEISRYEWMVLRGTWGEDFWTSRKPHIKVMAA